MINLSPSQQSTVKAFENFLDDPIQNEMIISGFAGSGKTFLVQYLYELIRQKDKIKKAIDKTHKPVPVSFTATTNKAAKVLKQVVKDKVYTIHTHLGLKVRDDYKTGKSNTVISKDTVPMYGIVFIDEASMIDRQLYGIIREYIGSAKVVYIGDYYQLPPVFEKDSPVFKHPNVYRLLEIQRQAINNPIIALSQEYRSVIDKGPPFTWPEIEPDHQNIFVLTGTEFEHMVRQKFTQQHHPDDYRILAYTNQKVIAYNKFVRSLYTNNAEFVPGEKVVTNQPVRLPGTESIVYPSEWTLEITSTEPHTSDHGVEGYLITFESQVVKYFYPKHYDDVKALLKHYAKVKDWRNYFNIKNNYLDIRPIHALTCHKAQGSTFQEVFIDLNDMNKCKKWHEVARLVYVAITRASERVYIYGNLQNRNS